MKKERETGCTFLVFAFIPHQNVKCYRLFTLDWLWIGTITRGGHFHVSCPQSLSPWTLVTIPPRSSPWQRWPLSTGLLWLGKEMWRLSFVFNTSDLLCFKISPSHEQMPRNGTASRAASTALHSPLAAVREKAMQIILFQRSEQNRDL